jgi:hypothetical protein
MNRINAADREKTVAEFEKEASKLELLQNKSRSRK